MAWGNPEPELVARIPFGECDTLTVESNVFGALILSDFSTDYIRSHRYFGYSVRRAVECYALEYGIDLPENWAASVDPDVLDHSDEYDETE